MKYNYIKANFLGHNQTLPKDTFSFNHYQGKIASIQRAEARDKNRKKKIKINLRVIINFIETLVKSLSIFKDWLYF
jgi:hypothetical protein